MKDRLNSISIGIEAYAISSSGNHDPSRDRQPSSGPARDTIWSGKVDVTADPITLVIGTAEQGQNVLLVWKTIVDLNRPRIRLSSPNIIFKASASFRSAMVGGEAKADSYLPSRIPLTSNILQPLGTDTAFKNNLPHLSALRLTQKQPGIKRALGESMQLTTIAPRACRVMPALSSRIRAQKAPFRSETPSMIASLEVDIPPFAPYPMKITGVDLTLAHGKVAEIGGQLRNFPMALHARDQIVCLYSLLQDGQIEGKSFLPLQVTIDVSIDVSDNCHPRIQVKFQANVDFQGPKEEKVKHSQIAPGDQLVDSTSDIQTSTTDEKLGVVIKFTAKNPVYVGEPFYWDVFVMNRSGRQRRLGLSMLHKKRLGGEKFNPSRPLSISGGHRQPLETTASPFVDDNLLYTDMKNFHRDMTQLICLNTDLKIGPLNPGSCYSTEMQFLALTSGLLNADAIRLIDYTTNEAVDLLQLPDIFAFSRR